MSPMVNPVPSPTLAPMTAADASVVARLHADSWQSAYRGILSDHYLDTQVQSERHRNWETRLATDDPRRFGVVAWQDGAAVAFVCVQCDDHPEYGSLIDNLHVTPAARSSGIGPLLLDAAAAGILARAATPQVYLWVYDANVRARAFYARMGGTEVEATMKPSVEGIPLPEWRVCWPDVRVLRR